MSYFWELKSIGWDILFLYKKGLHFFLTKTIIYIWTLILALGVIVPGVLLLICIAFVDPIDWVSIMWYVLQGESVSLDFVSHLGDNFFWIVLSACIILSIVVLFMIAVSYSIVLIARESLQYVQRKPWTLKARSKLLLFFISFPPLTFLIAYLIGKKKQYIAFFLEDTGILFSKKHFKTYLTISLYILLYIFIAFLIIACIFWIFYALQYTGVLPFHVFAIILFGLFSIVFVAFLYFLYRCSFAFILLGMDKRIKTLPRAKYFLLKSFEKTAGFHQVWKYFLVFTLYITILYPFVSYEVYVSEQIQGAKEGIIYLSGGFNHLQETKIEQYKDMSDRFEGISTESLYTLLSKYSRIDALISFMMYVLFTGMFPFVMTSFYYRVIQKK